MRINERRRMRILSWLPPSVATFIYTVVLKPKPARALAQWIIKRFIPAQLEVDGLTLVMNPQDAVVCGALALGCYESYPKQLFQQLLRPGMTVVDVGANIGLYTALAARAVGSEGKVLAIEPEAMNCQFLLKSVTLNGFQNVFLMQAAVSNHTGQGTLFINLENRADHRIFDRQAARATVPVQMYRLDDLLAEKGLSRVDIMKIDIQGAEALALEGMLATLRDNRKIQVMIEFWPWGILQAGGQPVEVLRQFRALDFSIFEIDDRGLMLQPPANDSELAGRTLERQHMNLLLQRSDTAPS